MRMATAVNLPMVLVRPQPLVSQQKAVPIKAKKTQAALLIPLLSAKAKRGVLPPPDYSCNNNYKEITSCRAANLARSHIFHHSIVNGDSLRAWKIVYGCIGL